MKLRDGSVENWLWARKISSAGGKRGAALAWASPPSAMGGPTDDRGLRPVDRGSSSESRSGTRSGDLQYPPSAPPGLGRRRDELDGRKPAAGAAGWRSKPRGRNRHPARPADRTGRREAPQPGSARGRDTVSWRSATVTPCRSFGGLARASSPEDPSVEKLVMREALRVRGLGWQRRNEALRARRVGLERA